jgi:hypothetical protein
MSEKASRLAGERTLEADDLLPLATKLVAVENQIFAKSSKRQLRLKRAELQTSLEAKANAHKGASPTAQLVQRSEIMTLENEIRQLDSHLAPSKPGKYGSPPVTVKNVLVLIAMTAAAMLIRELIRHWSR